MRPSRTMLLVWILLAVSDVSAGTLRQTLQDHAVPISGFTLQELDAAVDSAAVVSDEGRFLLAYPTFEGGEAVRGPLQVIAFDRTTGKLVRRRINSPEVSEFCLGSVLEIAQQAEYLLIETHINPSASCTLILGTDLRVVHTLFAWKVAQLGPRGLLLEEDQIHFAPVHPLRLTVFDLASGQMQEIYPPDNDSLRARFSKDLSSHLPPRSWCAEHNHPCDPASFDEELRNPVFAQASGTRVAFIVTFSAERFGDDAARSIGLRSAMYVYRREEDGWSYCQQELAGDEVEKRQAQLHSDFEAATESCSAATKVTVARVDSPFSNR